MLRAHFARSQKNCSPKNIIGPEVTKEVGVSIEAKDLQCMSSLARLAFSEYLVVAEEILGLGEEIVGDSVSGAFGGMLGRLLLARMVGLGKRRIIEEYLERRLLRIIGDHEGDPMLEHYNTLLSAPSPESHLILILNDHLEDMLWFHGDSSSVEPALLERREWDAMVPVSTHNRALF